MTGVQCTDSPEVSFPRTQCRNYTRFCSKSCCEASTPAAKRSGEKATKSHKGVENGLKSVARVPELPRRLLPNGRRDLNVQQILAGEFRLVGNEGKPRLGLGAHQPFDGIGGALTIVG